jgi:DNA (cytosine-5)-methyltransferase 1
MKLDNLLVDGFAGGGGASTGTEMALGRQVDIAINHDPDAILMHKTNHPDTVHFQESIWDVKPLEATKGRHVGFLWMSPDCKHFSKAKGGKPKDKNIRALPWAIVMWAKDVRPDVIMAENVEEIQTWGPLDEEGYPIPEKKGETFNIFIAQLRELGYIVEWKELVAADYGAPTIRKRWYMIARCDGKPIVWPEPTHSKTGNDGLQKWVSVSTCLDFSDLGKSIFGRKKPLAPNTMNRIARGIEKFVFNNPEPFIMQTGQTGFSKDRNKTVHEPLTTIVTKQEHCLVTPVLAPYMAVNTSNHPGGAADAPIHTITTGGHHALVTPVLAPYMVTVNHSGADHHYCNSLEQPFRTITQKNGSGIVSPLLIQYHSETTKDGVRGQSIEEPIMTIDASPRYALASTFLTKFYKTGIGQEVTEPLHTITTSPGHFGQVSILTAEKEEFLANLDTPIKDQNMQNDIIQKCEWAASFIMEYYGQGVGQSLNEPLHTVVTKDRFALVTIYGIDYVICDITLRMLNPRELYKAQGFPDDYIIDHDYTGKPYPISKQVARCGNSVVPMVAKALVEANCSYLKVGERIGNIQIDDSQKQLRFA